MDRIIQQVIVDIFKQANSQATAELNLYVRNRLKAWHAENPWAEVKADLTSKYMDIYVNEMDIENFDEEELTPAQREAMWQLHEWVSDVLDYIEEIKAEPPCNLELEGSIYLPKQDA